MPDTSGTIRRTSGAGVPFLVKLLATGFFSGYSKVAPGTAGSMVGILIYSLPFFETPAVIMTAVAAAFLTGVYVSGRMEKVYGEDPPVVVIDEIAGVWISLAFLPKTVLVASLSFLFFRFYDIFKPPPCRRLESVGGGMGIMLDDLMAGVYANLTLQILLRIIPGLI